MSDQTVTHKAGATIPMTREMLADAAAMSGPLDRLMRAGVDAAERDPQGFAAGILAAADEDRRRHGVLASDRA